jgi:hypothetical protein
VLCLGYLRRLAREPGFAEATPPERRGIARGKGIHACFVHLLIRGPIFFGRRLVHIHTTTVALASVNPCPISSPIPNPHRSPSTPCPREVRSGFRSGERDGLQRRPDFFHSRFTRTRLAGPPVLMAPPSPDVAYETKRGATEASAHQSVREASGVRIRRRGVTAGISDARAR